MFMSPLSQFVYFWNKFMRNQWLWHHHNQHDTLQLATFVPCLMSFDWFILINSSKSFNQWNTNQMCFFHKLQIEPNTSMILFNLSLYNVKSSFSANTIHSFVVFWANIFITTETVYIMPFSPSLLSPQPSMPFNLLPLLLRLILTRPKSEKKDFFNSIKCQIDFYHVCLQGRTRERNMISWSKSLNCIFRLGR